MRVTNPQFDVDLAALCRNFRRLADAAPGAEAAGVVKCDAYGLGAEAVATALEAHEGCRTFFVAYPEEGAALRPALKNPDAAIFVFNGPFDDYLSLYEKFRLTPVINTIEQARRWAQRFPSSPVALHVDTGMNRLGMTPGEISAAAQIDNLRVDTIISHLACSSCPSDEMNERQRSAFETAANAFPGAKRSIAASGGAIIGGAFSFDMVRLGVALYGASPLDDPASALEPVARLTAPVLQVKTIAAGESVGYGAAFIADREMRLATVALGYGDGYPRSASRRSAAILGGRRRAIIGRVSMDLIVLDASEGVEPQVGDRAEFFGPALSVDAAAEAAGTIGYELLSVIGGMTQRRGVGERVRRRYLWNGEPVDAAGVRTEGAS